MKRGALLGIALVYCTATGCSGLTSQEQQALTGGAIGAAGGAAIGALAGDPAIGAAVGGVVGTATGALWKDIKKRTEQTKSG